MNNVETSPSGPFPAPANLTASTVVAWTRRIYDALKRGCPGVPVVPGTGDGALVRDTLWPLGGPTGRVAGDTLDFHPCVMRNA